MDYFYDGWVDVLFGASKIWALFKAITRMGRTKILFNITPIVFG